MEAENMMSPSPQQQFMYVQSICPGDQMDFSQGIILDQPFNLGFTPHGTQDNTSGTLTETNTYVGRPQVCKSATDCI